MSKFKDNFSSESFYPDSNYYLEQYNTSQEKPISEDQKSNMGENFVDFCLYIILEKIIKFWLMNAFLT